MSRALVEYCIAKIPTPVLNTPNFQKVFGEEKLPLDELGLLRQIEMIALPKTKFKILKKLPSHIYEITTEEYPHGPQYIDSRFVESVTKETPNRKKILPIKEKILMRLEKSLGLPYIWGGNWSRGIPEISSFYKQGIAPELEITRILAGVDCSGLLYEVTDGFTPRNTSELLYFGNNVPTFADVKPLDILIYPGHVMIFLTPNHLIESLYGKGVIISPLKERLAQLTTKKLIIKRIID